MIYLRRAIYCLLWFDKWHHSALYGQMRRYDPRLDRWLTRPLTAEEEDERAEMQIW